MRGHGSQWISNKINIRHPGQLKKWKSWEPFESYQLNSTTNPAHLPQHWANVEVNGLDWQCCLAGSFQRAPRIFIFSIVLGAACLSYLKSIETHARTFFKVIIFSIDSVGWQIIKAPYPPLKKHRNWFCFGSTHSKVLMRDDCFHTSQIQPLYLCAHRIKVLANSLKRQPLRW